MVLADLVCFVLSYRFIRADLFLGRGTRERREETEEQAAERLDRMRGAVRTLLECVGEDPDREGLLDTPSRYAKALLFLTKGYQVNVEDIVNNALFREGHSEMVIVKDIEVFVSLLTRQLRPAKLTELISLSANIISSHSQAK